MKRQNRGENTGNIQSLRPSGFATAVGRAVAASRLVGTWAEEGAEKVFLNLNIPAATKVAL
jgi:hypothetical protein